MGVEEATVESGQQSAEELRRRFFADGRKIKQVSREFRESM
jgi:hypothetical protein